MVKYMAKYKNYIFVALVLFLAVEILIIFPQKLEQLNELEHQNTQAGLQTSDDGADQKMQGAHLVISREGRRDWELFRVLKGARARELGVSPR